jgi:hypothetical protein
MHGDEGTIEPEGEDVRIEQEAIGETIKMTKGKI